MRRNYMEWVKHATDLWQPVDAGMGRLLKVLAFHEQQDWLEYDQNIDLWMGKTEEKLTGKTPESEAPPTHDLEDEEGKNICETNDNDLEIDYESDFDLNHNLVVRKIKAIYDNGWYTESISWFKNKTQKLRVAFEDGTEDYISTEDIDGVEINLFDYVFIIFSEHSQIANHCFTKCSVYILFTLVRLYSMFLLE